MHPMIPLPQMVSLTPIIAQIGGIAQIVQIAQIARSALICGSPRLLKFHRSLIRRLTSPQDVDAQWGEGWGEL